MCDFYTQDQLQKRLGDGFYEQSLVRDQVVKATGQRYLSGYSDDESQYRALLSSGKSFTECFTISPGADLSAEQMAQVTADMVLMVNQTVTLPDGSTQVVSVPKLYARVQPGDLQGGGTLLAGNSVRINTADKVINSGSINGRELTAVSAGSLLNTGDVSGNVTQLVATGDIVNRGGQLKGGDQLALQAGNDILSLTGSEQRGSESWLGRQAGIAVTRDGGALSLNAGHDIQLTASALSNQGRDSSTRLIAGNGITLDTAKTAHATDYTRNSHNYDRTQESLEIGSAIGAGGSLLMQAGRDINLRAADVTATGDATLLAGNNLNLTSGEAVWDQSTSAKWTKHGFLSKTTHKIRSETHQQSALGSTVSGDTLKVMAGNDLTASGSNLLGTHDVALGAGHNLTLTTAAESDHSASVEQKKKSGFSGTGGLGFSLGKSSQKLTRDESSNVQKGSVAGSSAGSLTLKAGNAATVHGSDLVAGQDLTVQGKNVSITSAENSHTSLTKSESKSSGLTLGLSGTVGSALNTAVHQVKAAKKEESGRLAALKGTQAALTGYQAAQAAQLAAGATGSSSDGNIAGLTLSYGKQKSTSEQRQEEHSSSGSQLQAGRDMHIAATAGDLSVEGAQLKAGQDMALSASRDITLTSGKNSTQSSGHSSSHGGSVGAGLSVGGGAAGLSVSASADRSRGHENGSSLTHTETTADAGRNLTLNSGRDALLQGAQVSGESIKADIGHNLQIASEQDRDSYDMKQTGSSVGGSLIGGAGIGGSASLSGSRDKMNSDFASVKAQSGLFAGKGGFDISVGNHTQLDGGAIASTAEKEKNRLETGTLGWSDIHNKADYKTEHQGAGISTGGSIGEQFVGNMANNTLVGANGSGHDSSTTHAAVEDGTIIIRDRDKQQQDVATLDRDTEHAANGLSPIFNKEKEQRRLQEAQIIGEIGSQVGDIARTQGQITAQKVAGSKMDNATKADRDKAQQDWEKANPGKTATDKDISGQLYQNFYNQAFTETGLGTGGKVQQAIQAAKAAIQGLAGSDLKAAIAGGAAPYIATVIAKAIPGEGADSLAARTMAHAAVNAALAKAQGNNALAGAAGAATAEMMAPAIITSLGWDQNNLSETQKQTVSTLSTLSAGLAGGLAGGSTESAVSGAQAGKTTVENNALNAQDEKQRQDAKWSLPYIKDEKQKQQAEKLISDLNAKDKAFDAKLNAACQGLSSAACQGMRQELAAMAKSYDEKLDGQYIGTIGSVYKEGKDQVDALMWQYATADAKAEREANVNRIAENWGVSKETADGLYTAMAGVHTTAAIGGAVYGMKGIEESSVSPENPFTPGKGSTQAETKPSSGAENAATYPKLKDDLVQQNLNNIAKQDPRLAEAVKGSGTSNHNFSVGMGTAAEADRLGKIWVGDGGKLVANQKKCPGCWTSADGSLIYRPPSPKKSKFATTGVQANFQILDKSGAVISNGHLNITK